MKWIAAEFGQVEYHVDGTRWQRLSQSLLICFGIKHTGRMSNVFLYIFLLYDE